MPLFWLANIPPTAVESPSAKAKLQELEGNVRRKLQDCSERVADIPWV
jgi:hypothetical protein